MVQAETGRPLGEMERPGEDRSVVHAKGAWIVENLDGLDLVFEYGFIAVPVIAVVTHFPALGDLSFLRRILTSRKRDSGG